MNILSPSFILLLYSISFVTAYFLAKKYSVISEKGRYESIDGLRGLLALGVYFHHSAIWYGFLTKGVWAFPKSNLMTQLGETSVAFFFMITSFLFISKLLANAEFNWQSFFVSRILRLAPLYYFVIMLMVFICFAGQKFILKDGYIAVIKSVAKWLSFTIVGGGPVNQFALTDIVTAGVTWSLPYEWLFYFSLPLVAVILLRKSSIKYMALSIVFIIVYSKHGSFAYYHILSFVGGGLAAFAVRYNKSAIRFDKFYFSLIAAALFIAIPSFSTAANIYCKVVITILFIMIALGNNLFGLLTTSFMRFLGEICYSTYLIHGIVLFTWFYFVIGYEEAKKMSQTNFMLSICLLTPIVVLCSFFSYRYIEKPFIDISHRLRKKQPLPLPSVAANLS